MDLDRLRIADAPAGARSRPGRTAFLCLLFLAAGFAASQGWQRYQASHRTLVRTETVVRPATRSRKRFTAGGWVEVAAPEFPIVVSARLSERIETIGVKEGDIVTGESVVASLYDKDVKSRLALSKARFKVAEATVQKMKAGFRVEEVRAAEAEVAEADERVRLARANVRRSEKLPAGAMSLEALDRERAAVKEAEARLARVKANAGRFLAGYRLEDVAMARAEQEKAGAELNLAERDLEYCTLKVPAYEGILRVLTVHHSVGEWVSPGKAAAVVSLYDPRRMQVRVDVTQANIGNVRPDGPAVIVTEAQPDREYTGRVLRLEPKAELSKNTITVRVAIESPDLMLFPEMVAQVSFLSEDEGEEEKAPDGVLVPTAALVHEGKTTYVYVMNAGRAQRVDLGEVKEGEKESLVLEGLRSGQRVVVSDPSSLRDGQPVEEE